MKWFPPPRDFFELMFVQILRALMDIACQTYLSQSLLRDLKTLAVSSSTGGDAEVDHESQAIELDDLPQPVASSANDSDTDTLTWKNIRAFLSSLHTNMAFYMFSACFADCCMLFVLFLFQEFDILSPSARMMNWNISLLLIVGSLLFMIPLSANLLLTYQSPIGKLSRNRSLPTRLLFAFVPCVAYLYLFSMIPIPEGVSKASESALEQIVARVVIVGTFAIGLFSGIGAAVNMSRFLPIFIDSRSTVPTASEINSAEEALARVRKDLATRRGEQSANRTDQQGGSSWMSRVLGNSELSSKQREIEGLVALEYQMNRNVEESKRMRAEDDYSRSGQGRVFHVIGVVFSVYCVFRTASSIFNVFAPFRSRSSEAGRSYPDLVSHLLTYLFSLLPSVDMTPEHIAAVSRQISLVLIGVIILTSIRFVLRLVLSVLKQTNKSLGASLLLLILAQLMGTYLISTLVQLRTAFPPNPSPPGEDFLQANLLSRLPSYEMFGSAFDWSYLLSLSATGAYIWFDRKLSNAF